MGTITPMYTNTIVASKVNIEVGAVVGLQSMENDLILPGSQLKRYGWIDRKMANATNTLRAWVDVGGVLFHLHYSTQDQTAEASNLSHPFRGPKAKVTMRTIPICPLLLDEVGVLQHI